MHRAHSLDRYRAVSSRKITAVYKFQVQSGHDLQSEWICLNPRDPAGEIAFMMVTLIKSWFYSQILKRYDFKIDLQLDVHV